MMKKITESDSHYRHLEKMSPLELITIMNREDQKVAAAVEKELPRIAGFVEALIPRVEKGGRLFYIGSGTSGRLGILDASECPPTFGVPHDMVIGLIAGGDRAIRKAVEKAEDNPEGAWEDLAAFEPDERDSLVGIAASGTTPYVVGGLKTARDQGLLTAGITCNPGSPVADRAEYPIVPVVGPEVVTGSTRLKSGTAQKMVLNMISTALMVGLGRVRDHKMVDMQLSNDKLWERATRIVSHQLRISEEKARQLLEQHGSVRAVLDHFQSE